MPRKVEWYGWKPQLPDSRDKIFRPEVESLPASVDLCTTGFMPPVYDQGQLGSCTGNGVAGIHEYAQRKELSASPFTPSRLQIYYEERVIEGSVNDDSGAEIRDGIKVVATKGACPESEWPYDISKFKNKPPDSCYADAQKYEALTYEAVQQDLNSLKSALASGFPVVFGFTVYESFESDQVAKTGVVPMPARGEQVLGGHCTVIVGYDDSPQRFKIRNSWGTSWGQGGYCTMPYAYITSPKLSSDFWVVSLVGSPSPSPQPAPGPTPGPEPFHPNVERVSLNAYQGGAYTREVVITRRGQDVAYSVPKS